MATLDEIFLDHDGKLSDKWSSNVATYGRLFADYRECPVRILEIGIQNGGSLEIWSKYFPNAVAIVGFDIDEKCRDLIYDDPRISVIVGDVNDPEIVAEVCAISDMFDIIIDDGSHVSGDIVRTFARFFPMVTIGGLYIAEDLHCSYWSNFEGGLEDPGSSLSFFRRLADLTNLEHWGAPLSAIKSLSFFVERHGCTFDEAPLLGITQVAFCNSLAVVHRGTSEERALGTRFVVGQEAIVSTGSLGLHGTSCPECLQADNPLGPAARRRETLNTVLAERDAVLSKLQQDYSALSEKVVVLDAERKAYEDEGVERDAVLSKLQQDYSALSERVVVLNAERKAYEDERVELRNELAQSRTYVSRTAKAYVAYKVLSALARSPLPFGPQTRKRLARSAAKRDPRRSLSEKSGTIRT